MRHRTKNCTCVATAISLFVGGIFLSGAFAHEAGTAHANASSDHHTVELAINGDVYDLRYRNQPRRTVVEHLLTSVGIETVWRDSEIVDELISGQHSGTIDEIISRMFDGIDHAGVFDSESGSRRLVRIIVFGKIEDRSETNDHSDPGGKPSTTSHQLIPSCETEGSDISLDRKTLEQHAGGYFELKNGQTLFASVDHACWGNDPRTSLLLDPEENSVVKTGRINTARSNFLSFGLPDGRLIVFGGEIAGSISGATASVEIFDPKDGRWTVSGYLSQSRSGMTGCALADGTFLLIGGYRSGNWQISKTAELFDPIAGQSISISEQTNHQFADTPRGTLMGDGRCLFATMGQEVQFEIFDPADRTFSLSPATPIALDVATGIRNLSTLPDGKILILAKPSIVYDPVTGEHRIVPGTN